MVTCIQSNGSDAAPLCRCGCGQNVTRITKTKTKHGKIKGQWHRYVRGHWSTKVAHGGICKDRDAYAKAWRLAHLEDCRKRDKEKYRLLRMQVLTHYSGGEPKCACCGEAGIPFLTIDHIVPVRRKGFGYDRQKLVGTGLYANLRANNYPPGFQVLCFNCNCAKRTLGECPHKSLKAEPIFEHYPLS